eukprot:scaffold56942_cov60-Phaeocystis_antarctica.AAC.3
MLPPERQEAFKVRPRDPRPGSWRPRKPVVLEPAPPWRVEEDVRLIVNIVLILAIPVLEIVQVNAPAARGPAGALRVLAAPHFDLHSVACRRLKAQLEPAAAICVVARRRLFVLGTLSHWVAEWAAVARGRLPQLTQRLGARLEWLLRENGPQEACDPPVAIWLSNLDHP